MDKLISIIIPVWNVDQYLRKCLDSVLAQTYKNIEVILIDDESPDLCPLICDEYAEKDPRVKVVHQKNGGVCNARNTAMKIAKGEYLGFVDPDDWIREDMFEYLANGMEKYDADIVCCQYYRVTPGKEIVSRCDGETHIYDKDEAIEELVNRFIIRNIFWNKLFRREVFRNIEFPEGRIYEGTAMLYRLIDQSNKVVVLGDPKYYYYNNSSSYVNQDTLKHSMDYVVTHIDRYRELAPRYPELEEKLLKDLIKGALRIRYTGYAASQKEIDACKEDLKFISDFIKEHRDDFLRYDFIDKSTRKQLELIAGMTKKSFKKAHFVGGLSLRFKNLQKVFRLQPKEKAEENTIQKYKMSAEAKQKRIREIQNVEMDILDQIVAICDRHNLTYYLYGGTLLGAVRHKGFIPWDDDIDIVMPRKDYEKFGRICQQELDAKYFYQTCFTDKNYPMLFAKVRREESFVCEEKWEGVKMHKGIYVDIFPLDAFPDGKFLGKVMIHLASFMHQVCALDECRSDKFFTNLLFKIFHGFSKERLYKMRRRILKFSNLIGGKEKICSYGSHYRPVQKRVMKKEWFTGDEKMEFEGRKLRVPGGWKEYLVHLFGENYMELPPVTAQVNHSNVLDVIVPEEFKDPTLRPEDLPNYEEQQMQNRVIRQMQMVELDILSEIDRICRKHHIKYFIYGGTLLGAVRHKGFIPWDDDMDIVMLREDYDRFAEVCREDLGSDFYYQNCFTDNAFPMLFAKIRRNNSRVCEEKWVDKKMHKGIYVDILPLDDFTENRRKGEKILKKAAFLHEVCAFKVCHSKKPWERYKFAKLRRFHKPVENYQLREELIRSENHKHSGTKYVCSFGSHYQPMRKRVLMKEWFADSIPMEFEGREFQAPIGWEAYLLHLFGKDYMKLPPVDERRCHVVIKDTVIPKEYQSVKEKN